MSNRNRLYLCAVMLLLACTLLGCGLLPEKPQEASAPAAPEEAAGEAAPEPPKTVSLGGEDFAPDTAALTLPAGTTAEELDRLDEFTGLTNVDGAACACYEALAKKAAEMPDVAFSWQGTVCSVTVRSTDETAG